MVFNGAMQTDRGEVVSDSGLDGATKGGLEVAAPVPETTTAMGVESRPIGPVGGDGAASESGLHSPMLSMVFMGVGAVALAYVFARMIRKGRPARPGEVDPAERIAAVRDRAASERRSSIDSVMADATELTQRLASQLETKAARLEQLIAEADAKIAALEARGGPTAGAEPEDPRHAEVMAMSGRGMSAVEIARATGMPTGQVELILALRRRA